MGTLALILMMVAVGTHASHPATGSVDRIEAGVAVVVTANQARELPLDCLPAGVREGDQLIGGMVVPGWRGALEARVRELQSRARH